MFRKLNAKYDKLEDPLRLAIAMGFILPMVAGYVLHWMFLFLAGIFLAVGAAISRALWLGGRNRQGTPAT